MSTSIPPDPDRRYEMAAQAYWELNAARLQFAGRVQADYGKWLLVTITFTHLAAIWLISQPEVRGEIREDPSAYGPFVLGIFLMLLAGIMAWANWTLAVGLIEDGHDLAVRWRRESWQAPVDRARRYLMTATFWLPILFGTLSMLCLPWGAAGIMGLMSPHAETAPVTVNLPAAPWPTLPSQEPGPPLAEPATP